MRPPRVSPVEESNGSSFADQTSHRPEFADKAAAPELLRKDCPDKTIASPLPDAVSAPELTIIPLPAVGPKFSAEIVSAEMVRKS